MTTIIMTIWQQQNVCICWHASLFRNHLAQDYYSDQQEMDSLHISLLLLGRRARLCRFQRYQPMQCNCPQRAGCYARPLPRNSMLTYCSSLFFYFYFICHCSSLSLEPSAQAWVTLAKGGEAKNTIGLSSQFRTDKKTLPDRSSLVLWI